MNPGTTAVSFQDPNSDNWTPDPSIMLRQSVLSAVTDQRQALMAGVGKADQIKLDQYFSSVRDLENQLAVQLRKPEKREACVVPSAPKEAPRGASVDIVNANTRTMAKLLATPPASSVGSSYAYANVFHLSDDFPMPAPGGFFIIAGGTAAS